MTFNLRNDLQAVQQRAVVNLALSSKTVYLGIDGKISGFPTSRSHRVFSYENRLASGFSNARLKRSDPYISDKPRHL